MDTKGTQMIQRQHFLKTLVATTLVAVSGFSVAQTVPVTLLNVSYDPTRELYTEFNTAFAKHWKAQTGQDVTIKQSHGCLLYTSDAADE
jgi:ABC-type sulfate transport system substrate-binding protein